MMEWQIGGVRHPPEAITGNSGRRVVSLEVKNTADRAIQITSHYHFFEVNRALHFDRRLAFGMHLDAPAGTAIRFEPGETRSVRLCAYGGRRIIRGFHDLVNGNVDDPRVLETALKRAAEKGFANVREQ